MSPLISIVLCTYNGEDFLRAQLDSLVAQTYANLEFVVCDDCSTDGTRAILEEYARDERFRLHFNEENLGYSRNFEQGTAMTRGQYISFCDQDDIWMHDKIERLYKAIEGYSLVFSDSLLVDKEGKSLGKKLSDIRRLLSFSDTKGFVFYNMVSGHTMLIERAVLEKGLPIPHKEYHDWWFAVIAATLRGGLYLDEVLTHYRQHDKTVTINIVDKRNHRSRARWERWEKYQRDLRWIGDIIGVTSGQERAFLERLLALYKKKEGAFSWPLFLFIMRHQQELFRYRKKSYMSNVLEARKIARAEYPAVQP
jgi:glycosyltransferase involved in cell wall biosynthesis